MILKTGFILFFLGAVTVALQEIPVAQETDAGGVEQTEEKPVTQEVTDESPEAFDPTEEISEDYSIEFPVDI